MRIWEKFDVNLPGKEGHQHLKGYPSVWVRNPKKMKVMNEVEVFEVPGTLPLGKLPVKYLRKK